MDGFRLHSIVDERADKSRQADKKSLYANICQLLRKNLHASPGRYNVNIRAFNMLA